MSEGNRTDQDPTYAGSPTRAAMTEAEMDALGGVPDGWMKLAGRWVRMTSDLAHGNLWAVAVERNADA